jgi:4-hydroxy-tetrahydrodipicolinate reductase
MQVIIAGTGKLATELLGGLKLGPGFELVPWADVAGQAQQGHRLHQGGTAPQAIVVHAGSGRELDAIAAFCTATHSPMIELSTGSAIEAAPRAFPVVLCPNTNILMLKFMAMLAQCGPMFSGHQVQLTESHQASKTSVPGTALDMAHSLGLQADDIVSVRDVAVQRERLQIPDADLGRHAYHQVVIQDGACSIQLETRVTGDAPYAQGVAQIVAAVAAHPLADGIHPVMDFIRQGWL